MSLRRRLVDGENLVYTAKLHWIVLFRPLFMTLLMLFAISKIEGYALYRYLPDLIIHYKQYIYWGILFISFYPFCLRVVDKLTTKIGVTNQRLLYK